MGARVGRNVRIEALLVGPSNSPSVSGRRAARTVPRFRRMNDLDEARWRAVEGRDECVAGVFVYAVTTTGVYCRPGCGARRPLRRNVEFFATPEEAQASGYRACARCRPDRDRASDPTVAAVIAACRRFEHLGDDESVASVAADVGLSERHLRRRFTELVGVPIGGYLRAQRADATRGALRAGQGVTDAVVESGFGSFRAFYEHGATRLGMTPGRYRDGGRGERIRYTSIDTPLGFVVAACTARGVCAVRLGPSEAALVKELGSEFPHATIERDDDGLVAVAHVLAGAVRGDDDPTVLPLDLEGTAFQIRVWEVLRSIPVGETQTYSQVAAALGEPRAVRAVASACAANGAALTVPCHRVVRRDGTLGGYRWGVATKRALLAVESSRGGARRETIAPTRAKRDETQRSPSAALQTLR
jgi:AraC family transcriptional regulator of adaptative response/methylated-DNA-[protein]-cysteine methyltransferase